MFWDDNRGVSWREPQQDTDEWYNNGIELATGEDSDMAHLKKLEEVEGLEPIATRQTHPWGRVDLYAPQTDPDEWSKHDWVLVTETGDDGPLYAKVPADKAYEYYRRPWLTPKEFIK